MRERDRSSFERVRDSFAGLIRKFRGGFAKDGVYQTGRAFETRSLHEVDRLVDGGVMRYAVEIANLINPHPNGDGYGKVQLRYAPVRIALGEVVQRGLMSEHAKHYFVQESAVFRYSKALSPFGQEIRGVPASLLNLD